MLHRKWLLYSRSDRIGLIYPKLFRCDQYLESRRLPNIYNADISARLTSLFYVQAQITEIFNFSRIDCSGRVVWAELRVQKVPYRVFNDVNSLDIC